MLAGPVSFATFAFGLGAVAALYALHHLRTRPARRAVATLLFWRQSTREQAARRLWSRRFTHTWTFLLLTAIAALTAASMSADRWGGADDARAVIVIDVGSSMAAPGAGGRPLLQEAVTNVGRDTEPFAAKPTLIAAGALATVVCDGDVPRSVFADRLGRLRPLAEASNAASALELAAGLIGHGTGTIDWYTDRPTLPAGLPVEIARQVRLRRIAPPTEAVAIVGAVFETSDGDATRGALRVRLAGRASRPLTLTISVDGVTQSTRIDRVDDRAEASFDGLVTDGRQVTLTLADAPGAPDEHSVQYDLPRRPPLRFYVVGEIPRPLREALKAIGSIVTASDDAIVVAQQGQMLRGGMGTMLVIGAEPAADAVAPVVAAASAPSTITGLNFENATAAGVSAMPVATTPLLADGRHVWAAIERRPAGSTIYLSASLVGETADLPRRAAFPVLIDCLAGELTGRQTSSLAVSGRRLSQDPLWPDPATGSTALRAVFEPPPPLPIAASDAVTSGSEFVNHAAQSWTTVLTVAALTLLVIEGLLVVAKKII